MLFWQFENMGLGLASRRLSIVLADASLTILKAVLIFLEERVLRKVPK
jgi:hypothetical protein